MTEYVRTAAPANDQLDTLVSVLDMVRAGHARTRPELGRRSGLGRTVITQRVQQLIDCGLLEEGALGPSSGGRAPRELRFRADAGHLLVAEIGATTLKVAVTDLAGTLLEQQETAADITRGPEHSLHQVEQMFTAAVTAQPAEAPPIWGIGVSVPGPVEFATGRTIAPPIMPGWDGYPVRERLADAFDVPVWVDNDVNLMALGELRSGLAQGERDVVYIKIGTGIGAGLISGGRLHRGAQGCAGDVGHVAVVDNTSIVCRCGKPGASKRSPAVQRWPAKPPPPRSPDAALTSPSCSTAADSSTPATSPAPPNTATRSASNYSPGPGSSSGRCWQPSSTSTTHR